MTQIVLQWENEPSDTVSFQLQRATNSAFTQNLKTYSLDQSSHLFADTNREPISKRRFWGNIGDPLLDRNTIYYYRVKANLSGGGSQYSNTISTQVSEPVRGVEGDLWADVVLGKPDFNQNVPGKTYNAGACFPGGVVIDKTVRPNRMYIADCNNNRILGLAYFGVVKPGIPSGGNLARLKTYTKSDAPHSTYPDTNNAEFTDGNLSTTYTNSFGYSIPYGSARTVNIDIDLGSAKDINFAILSSGGGNKNFRAASLRLFISLNATQWTEAAYQENTNLDAEINIVFPLSQAHYVRFAITSQQYLAGGTDWLFIGDGQVALLTNAAIAEIGTPCSTDSDCEPGNKCKFTPERGADIVIGQPGFVGFSAGNGDSCAQTYPYRGLASADSLCFTFPTQISMAESIASLRMAVDSSGNLYVPDVFNNRVLKYIDPFNTDCIADDVWGQNDFTGNVGNKGNPDNPTNSSLRFCENDGSQNAGVGFDPDGNLWVIDTSNHRVLRFPKDSQTGVISKTANLVLGQPNFNSRVNWGFSRTLAQLSYPYDIEFDYLGRLYISDGVPHDYDGRVIRFNPPFTNGMSASQEIVIPMALDHDPSAQWRNIVGTMVTDKNPRYMWFQKSTFTTELYDLEYDESVTSVHLGQTCSIDIDCDGNLFTVGKWTGVVKWPASSWYLQWSQRQNMWEMAFNGGNQLTNDSTSSITGITTFGDQLIVADGKRILIWNDYDISAITNGEPADDLYGQPDFSSGDPMSNSYWTLHVDEQNKLWIQSMSVNGGYRTLLAFNYPFSNLSVPVKTIELSGPAPVLPVKGGGFIGANAVQPPSFCVQGSGDKIWVSDRNNSRVFRINNINGEENPAAGYYVDIILGQESIDGVLRNQGGPIGPQTLDLPGYVALSPEGDLFITDNGDECGSNQRIIQYNYNRFPNNPATVQFNSIIGNPDRVYGTGGNFALWGGASIDPTCNPFELGFSPQSAMVVPMNGYSMQRFPLVYLDPINSTLPDFALGDFTSYPGSCFVDANGNVYVGDYDWFRVLIYKKPFKNIKNRFLSMLEIESVPSTQNIKVSWRSRVGRSYQVIWCDDDVDASTWHAAAGTEASQFGTGGLLNFTDDGITTYGDTLHAPLSENVGRRYYKVSEERE